MAAYRSLYIEQSWADQYAQIKRTGAINPKTGKRVRLAGWRTVDNPRGRFPNKTYRVGRQLLTDFCKDYGIPYAALASRVQKWPVGQYREWFWLQVHAVKALRDPTMPEAETRRILHRANLSSRAARNAPDQRRKSNPRRMTDGKPD